MSPNPEALWSDAALRPFAPLVLAAWQDGWLTPRELLELRSILQRATWLNEDRRGTLAAWLDPQSPPSPQTLRGLQREVTRWLEQRPPEERHSLERFSRALVEGELSQDVREAAVRVLSSAGSLVEPLEFERGGWLSRSLSKPRPVHSRSRPQAGWLAGVRAELEGKQAQTREFVRQALQKGQFRPARDLEAGAYRQQVRQWLEQLIEGGVLAHCYPQGLSAPRDVARFIATFETLAHFDLSLVVKFGVQAGLFAGAVEQLGSEVHRETAVRALRGELWGCFAMTERAHGSNVRDLATQATYLPDAQQFEIHTPDAGAGKEWIGNAADDGQTAVVFAQLRTLDEDYGVHAFVVPIRDEEGETLRGVRIEDCGQKMGLNGVDNGRLWFEQVRVPRSALLDRFGSVDEAGHYSSPIPSAGKRFFRMLETLVGGRIAVGGGANAAAKTGLAIALHYAARRTQFEDADGCEKPLIDYVTHRLRLMPRLASVYAYSLAQNELVQLASTPEDEAPAAELAEYDVETLAAGLKAMATWNATEALQACRECCGGQGYLSENRIDALRTDVDVFTTFEGDNTVLLSLVANNLLRKLRKSLRDEPVSTVMASLAEDASTALRERTPWAKRDGSEQAIRDPELLATALRFREKSLLQSLARRVLSRTRDGMPAQEAFMQCQDHAIAASRAYVECFTFLAVRRASERVPELSPVCSLFGLSCIQRDLGWFFSKDFVERPRARALRSSIRQLADELAEDALDWVDALAVPSLCLGPLADEGYLTSSGLVNAAIVEDG